MFRTRLPKAAFALASAVLLTAAPAAAHTGHTVTVVTTPHLTIGVEVGANEVNTLTIDFGPGFRFAHDDQLGSELTPNPNDEEEIGEGTMYASWSFLGLCSTNTQDLTITWEESMTGAPAGAVAHYVVSNALGFDTDMWVIEENDATDDYKLTMDLDEGRTCSAQPGNASMTFTLYKTTASGGKVYEEPDCYTVTVTFTDTSGANHSGTTTVSTGGATC